MGSTWDDDPVVAVCKVGDAAFMDQLMSGRVYLNSPAYFAGLEVRDARLDPYEGGVFCTPADGATLSMDVDGEVETMDVVGPIVHTSDELKKANIFCTHMRRRSSYGQVVVLADLNFGDTAVLFRDFPEFLRRVTSAAELLGLRVSYGLVEYVDPRTYKGELGPFRKFSTYAAQAEHRIAIIPGTGGPLILDVGDLTDIALRVSASDRLKLEPKAAPPV